MLWFKKNIQKTKVENRNSERLKPEDIFLLEFQSDSLPKVRLGQGKDISRGGVRFATSAVLKKGDQLKMTVYFPKSFSGPRKAETTALVHRVHAPGASHRLRVACEFLEPSSDFEGIILSYIQRSKTQDLTPVG